MLAPHLKVPRGSLRLFLNFDDVVYFEDDSIFQHDITLCDMRIGYQWTSLPSDDQGDSVDTLYGVYYGILGDGRAANTI